MAVGRCVRAGGRKCGARGKISARRAHFRKPLLCAANTPPPSQLDPLCAGVSALPPLGAHAAFPPLGGVCRAPMSALSRPPPLLPLGFWRLDAADTDPEHLDPQTLVDPTWSGSAEAALVHLYLSCGLVESHELAPSWCRFGCPRGLVGERERDLGCATLTDGVYVWPEGLPHYVERHGVRPPRAFVDHARRAVGEGWGLGRGRGALLLPSPRARACAFDAVAPTDEVSALPRGTAEYLRVHSTPVPAEVDAGRLARLLREAGWGGGPSPGEGEAGEAGDDGGAVFGTVVEVGRAVVQAARRAAAAGGGGAGGAGVG